MKAPLFFLTGMPGAGKSYWARKIAAGSGLPMVDMDLQIEAEEQAPVTGVFARYGEARFRELERDLLHRLIEGQERPAVIACGGGVPCFFDNLDRMKRAGVVIYLKAKTATLEQRLREGQAARPLLHGSGGLAHRLQELYDARRAWYERADHIFEVETLSLANFTEIITQCTNRH